MRNWEELVVAYLSRFFPHALTFERRGEIIAFKQREDESLYNARERYKQLLRRGEIIAFKQREDESLFHVFA